MATVSPPAVVWIDGHKYRLCRPGGRPKKEPVFVRGVEMWRCSFCGKPKLPDEFNRDKNAANGLKSWCRACCRRE